MSIRDLEIGALKFGQLAKMASAVGLALYRVQCAIVHGSMYCAMKPETYRKLAEAQRLLEEVEADIARSRAEYEDA